MEAWHLYYSINDFYFANYQSLLKFQNHLDSSQRGEMAHIRVARSVDDDAKDIGQVLASLQECCDL